MFKYRLVSSFQQDRTWRLAFAVAMVIGGLGGMWLISRHNAAERAQLQNGVAADPRALYFLTAPDHRCVGFRTNGHDILYIFAASAAACR